MKIRKRNVNKPVPTKLIKVEDTDEKVDINFTNFQMKKLPNYSAIQTSRHSVLPNFNNLSKASSITESSPTKNSESEKEDSYSYSYSYSSSSTDKENNDENEDEGNAKENLETQEMVSIFQQLFDKFGTYEDQDLGQIENKIQEAKEKRENIQKEIDEIDTKIGTNISDSIWAQKLFFTELIDFIDAASSTGFKNFNEVKPEFLSVDYVIDKIKSFQRLDPDLYKKCGFQDSTQEIFEFYAIIETNDFSFTENKPFIDQQWIRTGWKWTDEFGNSDLVPKVFEGTCLPILINKLRSDEITTEENFHFTFLHCVEILDYCIHPTVAESQLFGILKKRLDSAFGTGKIKYDVYNKLMIEFGFKNVKPWEDFSV